MGASDGAIPRMVVKRLARYYAAVQQLRRESVQWVSSRELGDLLGLTSSTVRQDLSHLDFSGISKRGYETSGLEATLAGMLGADMVWNVAVAGAGNLGMALARHEEFTRQGFNICALLDTDVRKIGRRAGGLVVEPAGELRRIVTERNVAIGVIAVPAVAAQRVADMFILSGVKGVLNMAMVHVAVPDRVAVVDTRIVESFQELACMIRLMRPQPGR